MDTTKSEKGFDEWKSRVNVHLVRKTGMIADDLPDCSYYDWYETGVAPHVAATRAIKYAL